MFGKILLIAILLLSVCSHSFAEEYAALTTATAEDLLVFWEAKDLYVETATRHFKPISQTAENMVVITAKEIEEMNAHSVAEILSRATGIFVDFSEDYTTYPALHIQGSQDRHVLVMIDGIVFNDFGAGNSQTQTIPVGIIERIEIIKGPASSAWGSSLGGVVNIITKAAGGPSPASGSVSASYGEHDMYDYRAAIYGKAEDTGYYIFAGKTGNDSLKDERPYDIGSFYSKISFPFSHSAKLGLSLGYSDFSSRLDIPLIDQSQLASNRVIYSTLSLDASLMKDIEVKVSLTGSKREIESAADLITTGEFLQKNIVEEDAYGGTVKFVWTSGIHKAVLGADVIDVNLDQTAKAGDLLQTSFLSPAVFTNHPHIKKWDIFVNDTITVGKLSITPGIRYDDNDITNSFISPSVGLTYQVMEKTVLRASAARGFNSPPLVWMSKGDASLRPNSSLKPENSISYQGGIETSITDYLWAKANVFSHEMKDELTFELVDEGPPTTFRTVNKGKVKRNGIELEAETAPFYNVSLNAGYAYVHINQVTDEETQKNEAVNVRVKYDDRNTFMAQLSGHYIWWNSPRDFFEEKEFIWDLNARKKIYDNESLDAVLFFTAHNIFNGSQYRDFIFKNPQRWIEAGVRVTF
ncbi:MAG: TonB-dependent receptor [Nitrospirae bacterium]|nr:TonB-dependent receptor [Nitrospirota bacterium]